MGLNVEMLRTVMTPPAISISPLRQRSRSVRSVPFRTATVSPQPSFGCARKFSQQTSTSPSTTTAGTGSIPPPHSSPAVFSNRSEPSPVISTQSKPSKQL